MDEITSIARMIDHSILHPAFTDNDLKQQCKIAADYQVASVCVKPYAVKNAITFLKDTRVKVGCVIGFPHGNSATAVKQFESKSACADGATEIDMVINIGKALSGDWLYVENEINSITYTCHEYGAIVKVIIETDYITLDADKIRLCEICTRAGADYIKTSTGYGFVRQANGNYTYHGATIGDVRLMRQYAGPNVLVKAAGGIRTLDDLLAMRDAGASRIGVSATAVIMTEAVARFGKI